MRKRLWQGLAVAMLGAGLVGQAHAADSSQCKSDMPWTYQAEPGDVSSATKLEVQRPFAGVQTLRLNLCSGELRIVPAAAGSMLRLAVTATDTGKPLGSLLQTFSTTDGTTTVTLQLPHAAHAVVTLAVPMESAEASNEVNLGEGSVRLEEGAMRGRRELNLGAGTVEVVLDGDRDYGKLETNVGMGRLKDERPGGHGSMFVVARSAAGSGEGSLEINVGAGSIHLLPAPGK